MKFLDHRFESRNLMPIHIMNYYTFELGMRDAISILFKDLDTGQKFVETIDRPKLEVYVLKKELWASRRVMEAWEPMENLEPVRVSFNFRDRELGKILGCDPANVKYSPFLFGYDITVEHFYWTHFLLEYGNDHPKKLRLGFFDIESDIIQVDGKFAAPGEAPTSAVTFIDMEIKAVYTVALAKDNLPIYAETHPDARNLAMVKEKFYAQVEQLKESLPEFIDELHTLFDDAYGELTYEVIIVEDEINLHTIIWEIMRKSNIDFLLAWNAPYDVRNLIERPLVLGFEPESIICDDRYKYKTCFFEEDDNVQTHKRNHKCVISVPFLILCQMWGHAGIRAGQARQSMRLTAVGKRELGEEKIDYSEFGNIKVFMYKNWKLYLQYNIKDVLLQMGIMRKNLDMDAIYDRCYENGALIPEAFVSTALLTRSIFLDFMRMGYVLGTNTNKILPPFDYLKYIAPDSDEAENIEALQMDAAMMDPDTFEVEDDMSEFAFDNDDPYM